MRPIPDAAVALVSRWEGCKLTAYPDPASGGDPWTIGSLRTAWTMLRHTNGRVAADRRPSEILGEQLGSSEVAGRACSYGGAPTNAFAQAVSERSPSGYEGEPWPWEPAISSPPRFKRVCRPASARHGGVSQRRQPGEQCAEQSSVGHARQQHGGQGPTRNDLNAPRPSRGGAPQNNPHRSRCPGDPRTADAPRGVARPRRSVRRCHQNHLADSQSKGLGAHRVGEIS